MTNAFDEFDTPTSASPAARVNAFDEFDANAKPEGAFARAGRVLQDPDGGVVPAIGSLVDSAIPTGTTGNLVRGVLERTAQTGANVARIVSRPLDALGGKIAESVGAPAELGRSEIGAVAKDYQKADAGYAPEFTPEKIKTDWNAGNFPGAVKNTLLFGMEQGITSVPDMLLAVFGTPLAVASTTERIGQVRAENQGKPDATAVDLAAAAPFAIGSVLLDKFGGEGMLGIGGAAKKIGEEALTKGAAAAAKRIAIEGGKALTKEAWTEAMQEGVVEYIGEKWGTNAKMSVDEAVERGFFGALAGGVSGGGVGAGRAAIKEIVGPSEKRAIAEQQMAEATDVDQIAAAAVALAGDVREFQDAHAEFRQSVVAEKQQSDAVAAAIQQNPERSIAAPFEQGPALLAVNQAPALRDAHLAAEEARRAASLETLAKQTEERINAPLPERTQVKQTENTEASQRLAAAALEAPYAAESATPTLPGTPADAEISRRARSTASNDIAFTEDVKAGRTSREDIAATLPAPPGNTFPGTRIAKPSAKRGASTLQASTFVGDSGAVLSDVDPATLPSAKDVTADENGDLPISREAYSAVSAIAEAFGKKIILFSSDKRVGDGSVLKGDANTIYLNRNAQKPHLLVVGHEITHQMKMQAPAAYAAFEKVAKEQLGDEGLAAYQKDYVGGDIEEASSDLIGNRFQEPEFMQKVFEQVGRDLAPAKALGAITRMANAIRKVVDGVKATLMRMDIFAVDTMVKDLDKVKEAAHTALVAYAKQRTQIGNERTQNENVEQGRDEVGRFTALSSPIRNNGSGESAASLEAQSRIRDENAKGQTRILVDRDGTVRPLVGVNAVDQKAREGQMILQRNVGRNAWTVLDEGPGVGKSHRGRALDAAARYDRGAKLSIKRPILYPGVDRLAEVVDGLFDKASYYGGKYAVRAGELRDVVDTTDIKWGLSGQKVRVALVRVLEGFGKGTKVLPAEVIAAAEGVLGGAKQSPKRPEELLAAVKPRFRAPLAEAFTGLTEQEIGKLQAGTATKLVGLLKQLPGVDETAAIAWSGRAKRGWYRNSSLAMASVFGPDAPRFTALLAALSPQTSVELNLQNALQVWKNWTAAGRPTDAKEIRKIMGRSVQGNKGEKSVLGAWVNNSVSALTTEDPVNTQYSGPKVNSFFQNLVGNAQEVTNDTWMANYALIEQVVFGGAKRMIRGKKIGDKGWGYLAMNSHVRQAAARLTELTGEEWTPAEVQETVWSWAKALYEAQKDGVSATELLYNEELTDEMVNATPSFATLFTKDTYANILTSAGLGDSVARLRDEAASGKFETSPKREGQTAPFASGAQSSFEVAAARRLERLKEEGRPDRLHDAKESVKRQPDSLTITGYHFSKAERGTLSSSSHGSGLVGKNAEDFKNAADKRIRERVYFYADKGTGIRPLAGLGTHAHTAVLNNVYDMNADARGLREGVSLESFETSLLDAGFDGYLDRREGTQPGVVVMLGERTVPVRYLGVKSVIEDPKSIEEKTQVDQRTGFRATVTKLNGLKSLPSGALTPSRWGQVLKMTSPDLHAQMVESGVFDSGTDPIYKNELVQRFKDAQPKASEKRAVVNIGLDVNDGRKLTAADALDALRAEGANVVRHEVRQSNTEQTLIATLAELLSPEQAYRVSDVLRQDAIAQKTDEGGELYGPDAAKWAPFNPEYFLEPTEAKASEKRLLAPNGKPSNLNERQHAQVRTPAFKAWFGDWEKSPGDASEAVDENGEPLVVYHGTDTAGFSKFRDAGGYRRGELGTFATPSNAAARTYVRKGRAKAITADDLLPVEAEDAGIEPDKFSGVYAVFLNVRSPREEFFEGANFDGVGFERWDENGDQVPFANGMMYALTYNEAANMIEPGSTDEIMEGGPGQSTDSVVEAARRAQYEGDDVDGAIIRNVVDDGGGASSYSGEPIDIYVAFNGDQVKSADFNTGAFSGDTSDIRFSAKRLMFYSALQRQLENASTAAAPAAGWAQQIKGLVNKGLVKADEVTWSGIDEWLTLQGGKVTKKQVLDFLADNGVRVESVTINDTQDRYKIVETDAEEFDVIDMENPVLGQPRVVFTGTERAQAEDYIERLMDEKDMTRYGDYQLPGGANYQEVLLTLPPSAREKNRLRRFAEIRDEMNDADREKDHARWEELFEERRALTFERKGDQEFESSHWDGVKNVVAHLRLNDRVDVNGERVLFVEEIQSDWGQKGRENGFSAGADAARITAARSAVVEMVKRNDLLGFDDVVIAMDALEEDGTGPFDLEPRDAALVGHWRQLLQGGSWQNKSVPAGPFVQKTDSWVSLALKRVIKMAVDGGYAKVAFVNGTQSAERYKLSGHVDSVIYDPSTGNVVGRKDGFNVVTHTVQNSREIDDVVGKELGQRLRDAPLNRYGMREVKGLDLDIGGDGMKTFYDKIVPTVLKDVLRKVGGGAMAPVNLSELRVAGPDKRGEFGIERDGEQVDSGFATREEAQAAFKDYNDMPAQPGFDITPAMIERAEGGLPLFSPKRNIYNKIVAPTWAMPQPSRLDDVLYRIQNKHLDLKRVTEAIGNIADKFDPYLGETLYHGRSAKQVQDFASQELKPLLQELKARNVELADFEKFLHNRHAEERNVQIAKVNPAMPDGGSGIETADARAFLRGLTPVQQRNYAALAARVDRINAGTRALLVSSGLETQETVDAWTKTYSKYVPLQRADMDLGHAGSGTGAGFSTRGSASKRAMGSDRDVVDILGNLARQRETAITRAEKNKVSQALYGLAVQRPNGDFWLAVNPDAKLDPLSQNKLMSELIHLGMSPMDADGLMKEPIQRYIDPRTGLVTERINAALRGRENVIAMRVDGRDRFVFMNDKDARAERLAESFKNLDAQQLGEILTGLGKVSRWISSVNTQYNPIFGMVNFMRDVQASALNLSTTPLAGKQLEVTRQILPALRGIYIDVRHTRAGTPSTSAWSQLWEEFQREGGQTGYKSIYAGSAERTEALAKELRMLSEGKLKQSGRAIFDWLSDYNESIENSTRLAAYKVAKDSGLSNARAAEIAKDITVNFNRKGEVATQMGALYAFFNAAVQGTERTARTLAGPAGRKILYGGLLLGVLQALALAAGGFDDDEPPDQVKERNLVIPLGDGTYATIPMPLGFNLVPGVSRLATEFAMRGFTKPTKLLSGIGTLAASLNPIGSSSSLSQTVAPTAFDPIIALGQNKDNFGRPIAREDHSGLKPTPGFTRKKDTSTAPATYLAEAINWVTGGTKYTPGMASPTPDQIDYLVGQIGGGVAREAGKVAQFVSSQGTGEALPPYKVPVLGRLYGDTKTPASQAARYYLNVKTLGEHELELAGRRKDRVGGIAAYIAEHPEAGLVPMSKAVEKSVSDLRSKKSKALEAGNPERVKLYEEMISLKMKVLNDRVKELQAK